MVVTHQRLTAEKAIAKLVWGTRSRGAVRGTRNKALKAGWVGTALRGVLQCALRCLAPVGRG